MRWQSTAVNARIIFITPESAVTLAFGRFIDEKRASHHLRLVCQ